MRVGLDISNALGPRPSGVARYIQHLWSGLQSLPEPPEIKLYCRPSRLRRDRPSRWFPNHRIHWLTDTFAPRGIDVFHAPDLRLPRRTRCPLVVTIHDLSSLRRSDHAPPGFVETKRKGYQTAVDRASVLVTHTRTVRAEIHEELGMPEAKIVAVPLADPLPIDSRAKRAAPPEMSPEELLIVGGPSVRKGSERVGPLLEAWAKTGWRPRVTWVGSTPTDEALRFLEAMAPETRASIEFLGHVSDGELDQLYRRSAGLLQLSDSEGFGIPLLEAARRRCAVLSVDSPVLRETLGDAAFWFAGTSPDADEVGRRFRDSDQRQRVIDEASTLADQYSWERTARETLAAYQVAVSSS